MQVSCLSSSHERVKNILVPAMLLQARLFVPAAGEISCHQDKINEWIAQFLESYLTESQLNDHCNYQELLGSNPEISAGRTAIGTALYQKYMDKEMTERDLDAILQGTSNRPEGELINADHPDIVREFTEKYNALFALAGDFSKMLSDTIRSSLDTTFRKKFFHKGIA